VRAPEARTSELWWNLPPLLIAAIATLGLPSCPQRSPPPGISRRGAGAAISVVTTVG
jgi:hypothetical protein